METNNPSLHRTQGGSLRRPIAGLLLVGAALFTIGAIVERDHAESAHADAVNENQADHEAATEAARQASNESAASSESSGEGTVFGVDVESTRTIAAAIVGSLALAASILVVRRRFVFLIVGGFAFAFAFATLDVAEVVHQVGREAAGLATLAALVAAAHLAAGVLAAVPLLPAHRRDT